MEIAQLDVVVEHKDKQEVVRMVQVAKAKHQEKFRAMKRPVQVPSNYNSLKKTNL